MIVGVVIKENMGGAGTGEKQMSDDPHLRACWDVGVQGQVQPASPPLALALTPQLGPGLEQPDWST